MILPTWDGKADACSFLEAMASSAERPHSSDFLFSYATGLSPLFGVCVCFVCVCAFCVCVGPTSPRWSAHGAASVRHAHLGPTSQGRHH
jgi:hypothetical protein